MPHENNSALAFVLIGEVHSHPEGIEDTTPRSSRLPIYPVSKRALLTAEIDMSREAAVTEMGGRRVPHDSSCHWLAHSITAINKTAIHLIPPANDRLLHRDLLSISRPWAGKLLEYVMESEEERSTAEEGDCCSWMDARGGRRRKRFSEEQIKSLETMFETQTKLDPRQKLQLARELDLQPRQVAIWFQNKRARWKAKQLEREFRALKSAYDALLSSFESLKKEKQVLINQLQDLAELLEKSERSDEEKRTTASLKEEPEFEFTVYEDGKKLSYLSEDKHVLCAGQLANSSLTSSAEEQQFCFTTGWPSDQSCSNSQWWEFCL